MTDPVIVRKIERPAPDVVAGLAEAGVATVHEAMGRTGLTRPGIRPIQDGARVAGPAVTVLCPAGDNMMVHAAVEVVEPGDILVITTTSPSTDGMVGELLATSLVGRGCAGLVVDAGVRDVADLRQMGFPVWSAAIHAQGTVKETPGWVNVPVVCGGVEVVPGDVVVADDDGVVVVPGDRAEDVRQAAAARLAKERETRQRLEAGELGLDFYGLREKLEGLGVRWVGDLEDV
ncbi:MAG TPA: 4-carboxy-4-hydroxy-2-oxoadipate aldolase/oxaloacetate decarboxylase [Acidimicrobiia bacterium]|jgi:4-hydroxy-4-methyl-2-oxoglutarate aldolase|nr:4-carboxy-4-hydroxy-2-oxoadipate aldolase/oxaloacetate decarboxylase [Acidimicrobiia bacterium]